MINEEKLSILNKNQKQIMRQLIVSLVLLLLIRLAFFLQDGTNDLIESFLRWLIFAFSIFVFGVYTRFKVSSFKDFFNKYKDKFIVVGSMFTIDVIFKIKNQLELTPVYLFALLVALIVIALISLLLPRKLSKFYDIFLMIGVAMYAFGQDLYYKIFSDFFSFIEVVNAQEGVESAEGTYYFSILHVAILVLTIASVVAYTRCKNTSHIDFSKKNLKVIYGAPLLMFALANINAQFPVNLARLHLSDHYLYSSVYDRTQFVTKFSTVNLLFRDIKVIITPDFSKGRDLEYLDDYFLETVKEHSDNEYTGLFEGKNLIFVIGESFDSIAISEELTPNLYKMKTEGIDFQNHFTPVFPRTTCDSEVIFNTSLIPSITEGPTCYIYNSNSYTDSLPMIFNNADYVTAGFHSNYKEFYTRHLVYEGLGYTSFYGQNEIPLTSTELRYDSIFAEKSDPIGIVEDQPFFSSYLTISGHSPYEFSNLATAEHYDAVDAYYGDTYTAVIKRYIASQIEADLLIGVIIDDLTEKGELDDTVIIFTNDHYPYALDQDEFEAAKNIDEEYLKHQGVLYIWNNDMEHQEITKLTSSFDILPTINNLFNLDGDYSKYVGNDVYSNNYIPMVYFKDYSIFDGENHYSFSSEADYVNLQLIDIAQKHYEVSKRVLKTDYFKRD